MPSGRRRVKMKVVDSAFSGAEAVDWLLQYMQNSGKFNSVSRPQVVTLLQKFLQSDVIEDARGRDTDRFESGSHLYRFVKMPGPLNFLDDDVMCISNSYALAHPDEIQDPYSSDEPVVMTDWQSNTSLSSSTEQEMAVWKDVLLRRLVVLLDRSSLDDILASSDVDGRVIVSNVHHAQCQQRPPTPQVQQQSLPKESAQSMGHQSSPTNDLLSERESPGDIPGWAVMAIRCLSKWPERCSEEFFGGLPLYAGFEQDVLSSLVQYYSGLRQPLIVSNLYRLHLAILPMLEKDVTRAVDALQLCSLLLPQSNRVRLHRTLRFINKASANERLRLSPDNNNQRVLLECFSKAVLRLEPLAYSLSKETTEREQQLVWAMGQNYRNMFRVPVDLQREVELHLQQDRNRQSSTGRSLKTSLSFCQQVTQEEYLQQSKETSNREIAQLLDAIVRDENMPSKTKKQRLKQFQQQYPEIYRNRLPQRTPTTSGAKHSKSHSNLRAD